MKTLFEYIHPYTRAPFWDGHVHLFNSKQSYAYTQVCQLMKQYQNLWIDISYTAMWYLGNYIMLLDGLDRNRIILGSDINNKLFGKNHDTEVELT